MEGEVVVEAFVGEEGEGVGRLRRLRGGERDVEAAAARLDDRGRGLALLQGRLRRLEADVLGAAAFRPPCNPRRRPSSRSPRRPRRGAMRMAATMPPATSAKTAKTIQRRSNPSFIGRKPRRNRPGLRSSPRGLARPDRPRRRDAARRGLSRAGPRDRLRRRRADPVPRPRVPAGQGARRRRLRGGDPRGERPGRPRPRGAGRLQDRQRRTGCRSPTTTSTSSCATVGRGEAAARRAPRSPGCCGPAATLVAFSGARPRDPLGLRARRERRLPRQARIRAAPERRRRWRHVSCRPTVDERGASTSRAGDAAGDPGQPVLRRRARRRSSCPGSSRPSTPAASSSACSGPRGLEHGVEQALGAIEAGELPVVMSGDGLIGAVGGAMAGSETPLGILPGGRGNDLARGLGIPDDPEEAVEVLTARRDAADRRRRGQRQALPRHRQRRLRLRSQPRRQRNAFPARQPRLRLRRAADPAALEAGALHGPRRRRALPLHRLLGLGRQQPRLRRRHVHRARRRARRRRLRHRRRRRGRQAALRG